ncbi:hypothetical protein A5731_20315 [Mycolicibacterium conceptionense]|jgi:hypothetical protein|uniref:DUF732 domain-containing protein n=4 Tax=Mycolicibacterium TaxID=1866885 RepID=A0A1A0PA18_9MYCO|nr:MULTISPECIES: DUF732 domain-containing protein [Mycolicibacterium]MCW1823364.1 DUF732 domain-containing protein [Mycolicibacterium senegalense]MDR7290191.1 hypothetical protein [Mycolicibacterium senegalense]OBB06522.1 hypothetical protein A5718_19775 [Mycolicibacterium conceptionense]OBF00758.1 hypothetical protein A5731_20315 [Mycolicibacterium conceptionense]OBF19074.1 hypothetical protein A5726_18430 [Mycolicibacterium conceptionense]
MKLAGLAAIGAAAAMAFAAPAHADPSYDRDPDTNFAHELHTFGIYGQKDYNAWIGKIMCKRLHNGVDHTAQDSVKFVKKQLDKDSTDAQSWQFLGTAINYYCPDQRFVYEQAAKPS